MRCKCPKCNNLIYHADYEDVEIRSMGKPAFDGISYSCPHCQAFLGIGPDPASLSREIISALLQALKKP